MPQERFEEIIEATAERLDEESRYQSEYSDFNDYSHDEEGDGNWC